MWNANTYEKNYYFIKGYGTALLLPNTLKALPLGSRIHEGQYRKASTLRKETEEKIPYYVHCMKVCSTLISLDLPLDSREKDLLFASALLHDTLEDHPDKFPNGGTELMTEYGLSPEVLGIIKLLSKRSGATHEELAVYFQKIFGNKLALMIKVADRSHNTESLYVMTPEKIRKYIEETREFVLPMASRGKAHYPELSNGLTVLKSKIVSLIDTTEAMLDLMYVYGYSSTKKSFS